MPVRRTLPRRNPDLAQLKHQAKDLLRAIRAGDPDALTQLRELHPDTVDPASAKLADAQLVLARSYGRPSWTRLIQQVKVINAVERGDLDAALRIARNDKTLATIALDQSILTGQRDIGLQLYALAGKPVPPDLILTSTAGGLNAEGTELLFDIGARVKDDAGKLLAPVSQVLTTVLRKPERKHRILELYADHGVELPDTPAMAIHRGRIDLLEIHARRDHDLFTRHFSYSEIFPAELGCSDNVRRMIATPLEGATLLHLAVEFGEIEIAGWLLDNGMDVNSRAAIDANGFGGHTALFAAVVSQPTSWMNQQNRSDTAELAELLLSRGADPNIKASLWTELQLRPTDPDRREFPDVTPLEWGRVFPSQGYVNKKAINLLESRLATL